MTSACTSESVTVVMPVRNRAEYVAEAIQSILDQTERPGGIVVVDDGSEDTTPEVLARFGSAIRVIRQSPAGQFAAINRAARETTSPLLAFLDSDDRYTPRSIEARLARMNDPDAPDAVVGMTEQFVSPELPPEQAARLRFEPGPVHGELLQATLLRRSALERVGPLDPTLRTSANVEWVARARRSSVRFVSIDEVVLERRLHTTNLGILAVDDKRRDLLAIVRAHRRERGTAEQVPERGA